MINTNTKLMISGVAMIAIGATTYMVVKKAKEKKDSGQSTSRRYRSDVDDDYSIKF